MEEKSQLKTWTVICRGDKNPRELQKKEEEGTFWLRGT